MVNMLYALGSISVRDVAGLLLVTVFGMCLFDTPDIYFWERPYAGTRSSSLPS
jgi:hypothetical protein